MVDKSRLSLSEWIFQIETNRSNTAERTIPERSIGTILCITIITFSDYLILDFFLVANL